ncbi:MAG: GGDEF domain-containing protein [Deinococcales bacterium]
MVASGFAAHATFAVVFALLRDPVMAWATAAGLAMPTLAYLLLRRGSANAAFATACVDIALSAVLGTLFAGEASGFLFYVMVPLVLVALHPGRASLSRWAWVGLLGTVYVGFELLWPPMAGLARWPAHTIHLLHVFNVLVVSGAMVAMALLSAFTVTRAEHALVEALQRMESLALRDGLTDLLNRRAMEEALRRETGRSRRTGRGYSVLMADVDRFKKINDRYGHAFGDEVLRAVAARLRSGLREHDLVGRWGGEEFLMVLPETGIAGGARAAEKLRRVVEAKPVGMDGQSVQVTVTIGVASSDEGDAPADVVEAADAAMYDGKASGRNRVVANRPRKAERIG